jgi:hypothetical protein
MAMGARAFLLAWVILRWLGSELLALPPVALSGLYAKTDIWGVL